MHNTHSLVRGYETSRTHATLKLTHTHLDCIISEGCVVCLLCVCVSGKESVKERVYFRAWFSVREMRERESMWVVLCMCVCVCVVCVCTCVCVCVCVCMCASISAGC